MLPSSPLPPSLSLPHSYSFLLPLTLSHPSITYVVFKAVPVTVLLASSYSFFFFPYIPFRRRPHHHCYRHFFVLYIIIGLSLLLPWPPLLISAYLPSVFPSRPFTTHLQTNELLFFTFPPYFFLWPHDCRFFIPTHPLPCYSFPPHDSLETTLLLYLPSFPHPLTHSSPNHHFLTSNPTFPTYLFWFIIPKEATVPLHLSYFFLSLARTLSTPTLLVFISQPPLLSPSRLPLFFFYPYFPQKTLSSSASVSSTTLLIFSPLPLLHIVLTTLLSSLYPHTNITSSFLSPFFIPPSSFTTRTTSICVCLPSLSPLYNPYTLVHLYSLPMFFPPTSTLLRNHYR